MRVILCATLLALFGAGTAFADVTFCNRTTSKLQISVAHAVTTPYATKEINGWHTIEAGACTKLVNGSFLNEAIFYLIQYADGSREWQTKGEETTYPFCVRDEAFARHGTYKKLQYDCPTGWRTGQFYSVVIQFSGDDTLNFFD